MENHIKMDDLGGNTPIFGNTNIILGVCSESSHHVMGHIKEHAQK